MPKKSKTLCVDDLRHAEYYGMQDTFDELYQKSQNGEVFENLMDLIVSRDNILLAYRNIKANKGSYTAGTDKKNITDIGSRTPDDVVKRVRFIVTGSEHGYRPKPVRRKDIPKPNGKTRPLGIPCIWDRLIQQCIKQIMEPICEAKFSNNSYGFRPNRSVEHAINRTYTMLQMMNLHYVIEFDIKGFFDNVNHSKLIRQIWSLGIHDKTLIFIIKRILTAPIKMPDNTTILPDKGTPQGGIISPLLANIVLNELDWWIASQWEENPIAISRGRERIIGKTKVFDKSHGYRIMKNTEMKEMHIIRYADDFRIFCRTKEDAVRTKEAVTEWIEERLKLEVSPEKTRIVNTRKRWSEFLGFKIRVRLKHHKYVVQSAICDKKVEIERAKLVEQAKNIAKPREKKSCLSEIQLYNSMVLGIQNYYQLATCILSLKDRSYQPKPARREYIAKKNSSKKRPLGIQSGDDKLVQEVVKMILESIYEPVFSNKSHGFRPNRSCQTALKQIQNTFTGANWFVEGDIHACFDSFDHHVVIDLLKKRIDDETFIQLIWKFLKAGYMEQWTFNRTYSGVPQGSGVSPVLANIYLHEMDKFMGNYAENFNTEAKKKHFSTAYKSSVGKAYRYRKKGREIWDSLSDEEKKIRCKNLKELEMIEKSTTPYVYNDSNYKRVQYTRYADDFIIGVIGSKADAEAIKKDVKIFLQKALKLEMSDTKTKVTHTGDRARFLGYDITVSRVQTLQKASNGRVQRCQTGVVKLYVPRQKWVGKLIEYKAMKIKINENGKERFVALHRGKLVNQSDIEILARYNAEVRGLYNYYSIANDSFKIGRFANVMKYSMYKTFACKYKTTKTGATRRVNNGKVLLYVPHDKWVKRLFSYNALKIKYDKQNGNKEVWEPVRRTRLLHLDDLEILNQYNAEIRGLYNYYRLATRS